VSSGSGEQVKRQGPVLAAHLRSPAHLFACSGGARIVAVPTLRALAENAPPAAERVACILDAKRGGLYASVFERQDGRLVETLGPALLEPEAFAAQIARPALVLGRGILKARPALGGLALAPEDLWDPRSAAVARLAWPMHERGEYADPLRLEPIYIRRPEAEEIWERRIACQPGQDPA
jgi:tRNA threonylcarbamoyladenosine biosynthesis protein TsaB